MERENRTGINYFDDNHTPFESDHVSTWNRPTLIPNIFGEFGVIGSAKILKRIQHLLL